MQILHFACKSPRLLNAAPNGLVGGSITIILAKTRKRSRFPVHIYVKPFWRRGSHRQT
jgi:hypothetical protein